MSPLDIKRKQLELIKVKAGKSELEFRILEKEHEIERINDSIRVQDEYINKLEKELADISAK